MKRKLTPRQIVLRKYPSARCIEDSRGNGFIIYRGAFAYRGIVSPLWTVCLPTTSQAWEAAALTVSNSRAEKASGK